MKNYLIAMAVVCFASTCATPAFAIKQLQDQFKKVYAGEKADADLKKLIGEAKCNVCHVAKENKKKVRNAYGKAMHEALEKAEFPLKDFKKDQDKYADQLKEIFKKLESEKSGDEEHKTFADRMKAKLLPGGDVNGKME
ncbi:MAG: hypothetical protein AAGG44_05430 [Planctomycetota bacterium]